MNKSVFAGRSLDLKGIDVPSKCLTSVMVYRTVWDSSMEVHYLSSENLEEMENLISIVTTVILST
jgi:hypothetical protein